MKSAGPKIVAEVDMHDHRIGWVSIGVIELVLVNGELYRADADRLVDPAGTPIERSQDGYRLHDPDEVSARNYRCDGLPESDGDEEGAYGDLR